MIPKITKRENKSVAHLKTRGTVAGWMEAWVYDKDMNIEQHIPRQHNLITNTGMDKIAIDDDFSFSTTNENTPWRSRALVGSGSTAPAFTDTTLVNALFESTTSGGFDGIQTFTIDNLTNEIVINCTVVRYFTFTTSQNLTEYGWSASSDTGAIGSRPVVIRELFRDGSNNPITLTINATVPEPKSLRLEHTTEWRLPFIDVATTLTIDEYDIGNNVVGTRTINGRATFTSATSNATEIITLIVGLVFDPSGTAGGTTWGASTVDVATVQISPLRNAGVSSANRLTTSATIVNGGYTTGTFLRRKTLRVTESALNGSWFAISVGSMTIGSNVACYKFVFDVAEAAFTKTNQYQFELVFESSWARA